jgi:hypothetical protein
VIARVEGGAAAGHHDLTAAQDQGDEHTIRQGQIPQLLTSHLGPGFDGVVDDLTIDLAQGVDFHRQRRRGIRRAADVQPTRHQRQ